MLLRTLAYVLMSKAQMSVLASQMKPVSHPHHHFPHFSQCAFPSRPHPTLKQPVPPPHNTPKAPCIIWHPSGHTIALSSQAEVWGDAAICPGRTHTSIVSLTVTVNSWQSVPLGCPCRIPQWGYLTIKTGDTATLCMANRILTRLGWNAVWCTHSGKYEKWL